MTIAAFCLWGFVALITILFLCLYARRISWWFAKKPKDKVISEVNHKLALVIPARNEIASIGMLLESIEKQTYSRDFFDVYIVVKEEDDPVIEIAQKSGAYVFIDKEQERKGHALDYCLKQIISKDKDAYDAYVFVDADCVLDDFFMEEMNNSLASGRQVVNSKLIVKNYLIKGHKANTWSSKCNGLIWPIMTDMGNQAKSNKGITTMTLGTGLMIVKDLIVEWNGWPFCQTLTEDIELQRSCALNHYTTFYQPEAICYVEEAKSLHVTNIRRSRWMNGVVHCDRIYDKQLKKNLKTREDKLSFYSFRSLYYVYWYFGLLLLTFIASLGLGIASSAMEERFAAGNFYGIAITCFALVYLCFFALTLRAMYVQNEFIKSHRSTKVVIALTHPFFYMYYYVVMFKSLFLPRSTKWKVIKRVNFSKGKRRIVINREKTKKK